MMMTVMMMMAYVSVVRDYYVQVEEELRCLCVREEVGAGYRPLSLFPHSTHSLTHVHAY